MAKTGHTPDGIENYDEKRDEINGTKCQKCNRTIREGDGHMLSPVAGGAVAISCPTQ